MINNGEKEEDVRKYVDGLSVDAMARWICLIRGIRAVFNKLDDLNEDIDESLKNKRFFNRVERCINAYVEEQFLTVKTDIEIDHQKLVDTFDMEEDEDV